jgi:hypothetical protein
LDHGSLAMPVLERAITTWLDTQDPAA